LAEHVQNRQARFILVVSGMEVLAERPERTGDVRLMVDKMIDDAKVSLRTSRNPGFNSLISALRDIRKESIGSAIRLLAVASRPDDDPAVVEDLAPTSTSAEVSWRTRVDRTLI
jgi:hypothetical protein